MQDTQSSQLFVNDSEYRQTGMQSNFYIGNPNMNQTIGDIKNRPQMMMTIGGIS